MSRRRNISPVGGVIGALQIQKSLTDFESLEFANSPEITLRAYVLKFYPTSRESSLIWN